MGDSPIMEETHEDDKSISTITHKELERKRKLQSFEGPRKPNRNEPRKNTAIYVSGLPEDTTVDELREYFGKYGVIMDDMFTGGPRIKLYDSDDGSFKGEALIVYLREESAKMAIDMLDDSLFRPEVKITVAQAVFETAAQASENEDAKVDKKTWRQHMQQMSKKLEWTANDYMSPEEEIALQAEMRRRAKYSRIVVLRGMFRRKEANSDFILDLKHDLVEECERLGEVTSVHVLVDLEICTVKFREKDAAAACLRVMNGRFFAGHRIGAQLYDGSFSLKEGTAAGVDETEVRLERFGEWLEAEGPANQ